MAITEQKYHRWWVELWLGLMLAIILGILLALWLKPVSPTSIQTGSTLGTNTQSSPIPKNLPTSSPTLPASPNPSAPSTSPAPLPLSTLSAQPTLPAQSTDSSGSAESALTLPIFDSFENGLTSWEFTGDVKLIQSLKIASIAVKPYVGQYMIQIGSPINPGKPLSQNQLSHWLPATALKLSFAYNFVSYDYQGFDDPGFTVSLNDQVIYKKSAADIDRDLAQTAVEKLDSTGWQLVELDLPAFTSNQQSVLTFRAGNDELNLPSPNEHQSWVYLDSIKIE